MALKRTDAVLFWSSSCPANWWWTLELPSSLQRLFACLFTTCFCTKDCFKKKKRTMQTLQNHWKEINCMKLPWDVGSRNPRIPLTYYLDGMHWMFCCFALYNWILKIHSDAKSQWFSPWAFVFWPLPLLSPLTSMGPTGSSCREVFAFFWGGHVLLLCHLSQKIKDLSS